MQSIVITGTDTGIGKTVLCATIMAARKEYSYWKPIQSGTIDGTDSETVQQLSGAEDNRILPERYIFTQPLSPHASAHIDGKYVDPFSMTLPSRNPLIVEGAGGLLVPLNDNTLYIDLFRSWEVPVVLACRSSLGTINHTLLSLEALRLRRIPILGCVIIGEENKGNEQAIEQYGKVEIIGKIPQLESLDTQALTSVYNTYFAKLHSLLSK